MAFLSGWTRAIPISIPAAYVTGSITNFPGLIDLSQAPTATRQAIAASAKADGSDLGRASYFDVEADFGDDDYTTVTSGMVLVQRDETRH